MMRKDDADLLILFVCTGNTCRSPMAAALMRRELDMRGCRDIVVESAGLSADDRPAGPNAVLALSEFDRNYAEQLKSHKSQNVTSRQIETADYIAVMSRAHADALEMLFKDKIKSAVHILSDGNTPGIDDPYGGDIEMYRRTLEQLKTAVGLFADIVCSKER